MWNLLTYFLLIGVVRGSDRADPIVETKLGVIRGMHSDDGNFSMFLGIPFGKVNKNNPFGVATPYPRFEETFLAIDDSVKCPQVEEFNNTIVGTLDCLFVNIHVPRGASPKIKLPVLIWIYGGKFQYGFTGRYLNGPKYIVKHDVIFVTFNYRIGPYGFMCLDTPEVPGNQGLKDQLLALRWINENIESFGGDINSITLGGDSAGASSVEFHLWSKKEKLFDRVIIQSGSVFGPYAVGEADYTQPLKLAERLGYHTDVISKALSFLVKTEEQIVIQAVKDLHMSFKICVEKDFENIESFLNEHPRYLNVPKVKKTPMIIGCTDKEAMDMYENRPESAFKIMNVFNESLNEIFNYDKDFFAMEEIVRKFYIGDKEFGNAVKGNLTDFSSDFMFIVPMHQSLQAFLDNGAEKIYQYVFTYNGIRSFTKKRYNITTKGAAHADDVSYLFHMTYDPSPLTEGDQHIINMLTKLWTNFVKYGNPTPETTPLLPIKWFPATKESRTCLNINSVLSLEKCPFKERAAFWRLFFKANKRRLKGYNATAPFK